MGVSKYAETDYFLVGQTRYFYIPPYSTYINLHIENMVFIAMWRTVYTGYLSPWNPFCIKIGGTTLDPTLSYC